jgi:hypothetical protein
VARQRAVAAAAIRARTRHDRFDRGDPVVVQPLATNCTIPRRSST